MEFKTKPNRTGTEVGQKTENCFVFWGEERQIYYSLWNSGMQPAGSCSQEIAALTVFYAGCSPRLSSKHRMHSDLRPVFSIVKKAAPWKVTAAREPCLLGDIISQHGQLARTSKPKHCRVREVPFSCSVSLQRKNIFLWKEKKKIKKKKNFCVDKVRFSKDPQWGILLQGAAECNSTAREQTYF